MTEDDLKIMRDEIARAIKLQVNGKIDAISTKIDQHNRKHEEDMEEIKPYMQFASGLGVLWKIILMLGSLAVAWATIKSAFPNFNITL